MRISSGVEAASGEPSAARRIRISARLVRAATDEYLWAERYDRDLADVLALQDEVARAIAGAIGQTLRAAGKASPRKVDPEVYLLDLRARHQCHQRTEASSRSALQLFEQAIARLEEAYGAGDTMLRDLKADPHWDRMRSFGLQG